ncbi:MAG: nucleotide exchange factor GrpE [Saprospirales bacterium]|nr:MAG: nucleotide exchange factor GrpE [Saprospirales bacterium]
MNASINDSNESQGDDHEPNGLSAEKTEETGENELEILREEINKQRDKNLRLLAEFENYKKRSAREFTDLIKTASRDIMADLLPVLDDFDRALKIIHEQSREDSVAEGLKLVHHKLFKTLESRGLKPMDTEGADFDPDRHEALTEIPAPSEDLKGKVVDTIEKGYLLNEKIIRHAKVVVGK